MPLPRIAAWFRPDDYDAIKRLSPNDPDLPDTFDEWLQAATKQIADLELNGIAVQKVVVNSKELSAWCRGSGVNPDSVGHSAFAVAKSWRQKDGGA
jgi:hypothetical protein